MKKNTYIKNHKQVKNYQRLKYKKLLAAMLVSCILSNTAGCGVLLYPERQGQKGGDIDVQVALLNGIGLVFFLVPGLVAFAIDFHQGTIYLPNTYGYLPNTDDSLRDNNKDFANHNGLHSIKLGRTINAQTIERVILDQVGVRIDLSAQNIRAQTISLEQLGMISTVALLDRDSTVSHDFQNRRLDKVTL